jgi:hypothetical protein
VVPGIDIHFRASAYQDRYRTRTGTSCPARRHVSQSPSRETCPARPQSILLRSGNSTTRTQR